MLRNADISDIKKKEKMVKKKESKPKAEASTLRIVTERDIANDFAMKVYKRFDKMVKSIVLFGSQTKGSSTSASDIDIIIIVDDASIAWDQELIAWYREELGKLVRQNPYKKELHINTVRLITWWQDLLRGDPVVINIIRYGEPIIDFGGFFSPLKVLLQQGKIKSTPEAIYTALERAPQHLARSRLSELGSIEGLYWACVDSAHALLMAAKQSPPSPEHIPIMLKEMFVDTGNLKMKHVIMYRDLYLLHRKIAHGEITDLKGVEIDSWQERTQDFISVMTDLLKKLID